MSTRDWFLCLDDILIGLALTKKKKSLTILAQESLSILQWLSVPPSKQALRGAAEQAHGAKKKKKKKTRLTKEREKSTLERVLTNESHIQRILALLATAGARIKNPSLERMKQRLQCHHEITAEDRIGCLLLEMLDVLYSEGQRRFVLGWTCTG